MSPIIYSLSTAARYFMRFVRKQVVDDDNSTHPATAPLHAEGPDYSILASEN